jgi:hypothetical protein
MRRGWIVPRFLQRREPIAPSLEIALAEIDRVRDTGVRFGGILADAGYGLSGPFRQALTERGLIWAVGIPYKLKSVSGRCRHDLPGRWPRATAQEPCA